MGENGKLIVFDLDGTLNRTDLFGVEVLQKVQGEFGWPVQTREEIIATFGAPYAEYMEKLLPGADEETKKKYSRRVGEMEYEYLHLAAAYDNCAELMDRLHEKGWITAVCSNASLRYIAMCLEAIGLMEKIDHIQPLERGMGSKGESLKLLLGRLAPCAAVMVGDTMFDLQAARDNSLPFIGCRYGFRPQEMEKAEFSVEKPLEILDVLEKLCML